VEHRDPGAGGPEAYELNEIWREAPIAAGQPSPER
jgi:hypothetical protein